MAALICSKSARPIDLRAKKIRSHPFWIAGKNASTLALMRRFARLRFTAFPIE
ncbi:MAG TPA: hypothetical protein VMS73_01395 [Anaerolineaceae bacterium]|nr:hypothetical protein [Anaerolineaceae bacterium]